MLTNKIFSTQWKIKIYKGKMRQCFTNFQLSLSLPALGGISFTCKISPQSKKICLLDLFSNSAAATSTSSTTPRNDDSSLLAGARVWMQDKTLMRECVWRFSFRRGKTSSTTARRQEHQQHDSVYFFSTRSASKDLQKLLRSFLQAWSIVCAR